MFAEPCGSLQHKRPVALEMRRRAALVQAPGQGAGYQADRKKRVWAGQWLRDDVVMKGEVSPADSRAHLGLSGMARGGAPHTA